MSRSNQTEPPTPELHEFGHSKMPVDQFYANLSHVYVYNEGLKRAEAYYTSELRILKEPSKKLKTCHEYVIAVIKRTDGKGEVNYLAFERSIGKQPQQNDPDDPHPPHPNRLLERQLFMDRRESEGFDNEDRPGQGTLRPRPALVDRAMASTTSLDSIRKKEVLADDRILVLNRPYCQKEDKLVAVLHLQPPPNAIISPEPSTPTSSSTPNTHRFLSRKLSNPLRGRIQSHRIQRTISGPSEISYVPRDGTGGTSNIQSTNTTTNESLSSTTASPTINPKPMKRSWIYLYELVIIAHRLNKSKSLYRVFSKNCYWFAGMMMHVVRLFTDTTLELRDGNRIGHIQPGEDMLSWYDKKQVGMWMNVIRVVKTPRNYTLEALVEEFWMEKVQFEERVVHQRLQHTRLARERERRKEEELRKAREDAEVEKRRREEERAINKEELRRVREEEQKKNEELEIVREEERKKNEEELRWVQKIREEEQKKNEEELERVRNEQEKERKAREETEQRMKTLVEYLKAGKTPPQELLTEISRYT